MRELDRLEAAAGKGRGLSLGDKRSRLLDALTRCCVCPALMRKELAMPLKIAPQTGTALLRGLAEKGAVREVTGRGSIRAYAIQDWAFVAAPLNLGR